MLVSVLLVSLGQAACAAKAKCTTAPRTSGRRNRWSRRNELEVALIFAVNSDQERVTLGQVPRGCLKEQVDASRVSQAREPLNWTSAMTGHLAVQKMMLQWASTCPSKADSISKSDDQKVSDSNVQATVCRDQAKLFSGTGIYTSGSGLGWSTLDLWDSGMPRVLQARPGRLLRRLCFVMVASPPWVWKVGGGQRAQRRSEPKALIIRSFYLRRQQNNVFF